ncbi:MAG: hypothetical protein SGJ27_29180 [Candidatus Melainabacteria bacterium]|nr:hypothetical protein [Candidatus Melainabacteria bacterium]
MNDRLKIHLAHAEQTASELNIDQIAFLIGSFPLDHSVRTVATDCPRISALLPEMQPCATETLAMMRVSQWMNREDIVGEVADYMRRAIRG